jgi:cysteine desulfurase
MIYLDHHATTPLDPAVLDAMLPLLREHFANPGSTSHEAGRIVATLVEKATIQVAAGLNAEADEIVFTSGATESINLALFGTVLHPREKRRRVISVVSEHRATLDPLLRLEKMGLEVIRVPVLSQNSSFPGCIDLDVLQSELNRDTALVSVMLANNEIGTVQPVQVMPSLRGAIALRCSPSDRSPTS